MRALEKGAYRTVAGKHYGTPKELWGFRSAKGKGKPAEIAEAFLRANAELLGLGEDFGALEHQKTIPSLGADHVIFQQRLFGRRVHRAYVTVHVGRDGRVFLVKNRAMPSGRLPTTDDFRLTEAEAVRRAARALRGKRRATLQATEEMWFPRDDKLVPAWRIRLVRTRPQEEWIVYVNAKTGGVLSKHDNIARATAKALVFDPSPVTAIGDHASLLTDAGRPRRPPPEAYRKVTLYGLGKGRYLDGKRVSTNATRKSRRVRRSGALLLRAHEKGFEEVMVYHHVDSALRYLERLGYRGSRAIFRKPLRVNVNGTPQDNSWFSPWDKTLTFGTGAIDDAEDGETILHELGHAIQDAICHDFGQSEEAAAMGEGFGDYFAASFFADRKPVRYRTSVMTWDGLLLGLEDDLEPPCLRHVDYGWTYEDFIEGDAEHENGQIWSSTLWDIRVELGGMTADRLILESHFQLDGFTTFARGARAIMDADENLNGGANRTALRTLFRARKIGPV